MSAAFLSHAPAPDAALPPPGVAAGPLSRRLREATQTMHRRVERTEPIAAMTRGRLRRGAYALLIRDRATRGPD